ncbi:MAG: CTP-dependent riboflavin kinase [Candidatus Heimdallarchaeota archaeon]|nr:CTP-dependent riboflavin kinase [Candidatus Heimdallarchaeota archaeon]MCK4954183.1 CTP-dependent riboflavin kinase [Candidatus Heimdallarchaeota archaeon]
MNKTNIFHLSSREVSLLIYLAQNRAIEKEIEITTTKLAEVFSISQQTASRCLLKLGEMGIITWKSSPKGSLVQLRPAGVSILHKFRFEIERALHPDLTSITIRGNVFSGLGEGKYYISRTLYMQSFVSKLGYKPYLGTLNLRIQTNDSDRLDLIRGSWPVIIPGFEEEGRRFGDVLCYPLTIPKIDAKIAGIIPRRTHYGPNILELISDVCLREVLELDDGDEVTVVFSFDQNAGSDNK